MSQFIRMVVRGASLLLAVSALALILNATAVAPKAPRFTHIVDLTHTLSGRFPVIPVPGLTFAFEQKPIATVAKDGEIGRASCRERVEREVDEGELKDRK